MKRVFAVILTMLFAVGLFAACDRPLTKYPVPSAETFATDYFEVVGDVEQGTSGASLKLAKAAVQVYQFAQDNNIASTDIETMRANMLEAWENVLTKDQQSAFDANFLSIVDFLKTAHEDYDQVAGTLEDAGVKETYDQLAAGENAWENWDTLSAHTITLGNSDG